MLQTVNPTSPFKSRLKDLLNEYADMQWDLLPIGKTKKSGKMKNNYPRALRIQRKSVLLQYITYLYNISQDRFDTSLKMKNASQVCCLTTRPGGLLSFSLTTVFIRCCKDNAFFSICNAIEELIFYFPKLFRCSNYPGIPWH